MKILIADEAVARDLLKASLTSLLIPPVNEFVGEVNETEHTQADGITIRGCPL